MSYQWETAEEMDEGLSMSSGPMPELSYPAEKPEEIHSIDAAAALRYAIDRLGKEPSCSFTELLDGVLLALRSGDSTFIQRNRPVDMVIHRLAVATAKHMIRSHQVGRLTSVYPLAQFRCTLAQSPCAQARALHGTIYSSDADRPKLPLAGCNVLDCACRYRLMTTRQASLQGAFRRD